MLISTQRTPVTVGTSHEEHRPPTLEHADADERLEVAGQSPHRIGECHRLIAPSRRPDMIRALSFVTAGNLV